MKSGLKNNKDRFLAVLKINIAIFILEIYTGWYSGSLSMTSDGFHVSLHIIVSIISLISEYKFLGYSSREIKRYAATANVMLFFPLAILIAYEAMERYKNPPDLNLDFIFLSVAIVGLIGNIWAMQILHAHDHNKKTINNRWLLFIHMLFDALGSLILILSTLLILGTDWYLLDPITSLILAGLILFSAIFISLKMYKENKSNI